MGQEKLLFDQKYKIIKGEKKEKKKNQRANRREHQQKREIMRFKKSFTCIDMHTEGEAARIVTSGLPHIPGSNMAEKKAYLQENMDYLRRGIMLEPRGHDDMFGAFLFDPIEEGADLGIVFMDTGGYLNMCGHNSIAAVTAAVETGIVSVPAKATNVPVVLDTPAGLVRGTAHLQSGTESEVSNASIINVPSFLYQQDVVVVLPKPYGEVRVDIAFGGNFFAIVPAEQLGIDISVQNLSRLQEAGELLRTEINRSVKVQHPQLPHINTVDCVEIYGPPTNPEANYKNVVIFGNRQADRSPCGTGTSAKMATLYAKGQLRIGETFVYESILGSLFQGRVLGEERIPGVKVPVTKDAEEGMLVVTAEITGKAFIMGFNTMLFDPTDPFKNGFTLKQYIWSSSVDKLAAALEHHHHHH
nr:Chain A, B-cell Mitogen [Trypanosoma cruzi]1W61_B Chain B, B-cell Mitogen [Trypanosoma cruzi]1W62_A Chain A, Proline racemase A [Trypanosoma cruzi strain CL Brener]1W62_B Chain B, Proline racemase A [Trypanosoma cruzi strain CL Brener]6HJE_A Chain A, Proline racemase A [Trypanosoma cruzi strain CL Brener]6HJE_B Chain B, Proline racemase A [Trypanosoma cruzi strain CL Brener]6HJF_A Chain A, Proline racemase A [Trypanosoma cruzi strain CL Brener]6HJF_B Chain B, Proline racemase A [Trypanoso